MEVDLEERGPETPSMVLVESKANESSCPSWLRKVCPTSYFNEVLLRNRWSSLTFQEVHFQSFLLQELLDAEFIPMPGGSGDSMSSPLASSFSHRATLPYEELQELKAAAAAAASGNGFMVWALEMFLSLFCCA